MRNLLVDNHLEVISITRWAWNQPDYLTIDFLGVHVHDYIRTVKEFNFKRRSPTFQQDAPVDKNQMSVYGDDVIELFLTHVTPNILLRLFHSKGDLDIVKQEEEKRAEDPHKEV